MKQIARIQFANLLVGLIVISTILHISVLGFDHRPNPDTGHYAFSYLGTDVDQYKPDRTQALKYKDSGTAVLYSLGITAGAVILASTLPEESEVGALLFTLGFIGGPSAGSIYADDWKRAVRGSLIRTGSLAIAAAGAFLAVGGIFDGDGSQTTMGVILMYGGAGVYLISSIYDIFHSSRKSVEDYNKRAGSRADISISPWINPAGRSAGFQVGMSF